MINLYSDTQTRPTDAMRQAIASAEVADEQRGQDPTTLRLQERVAELLGADRLGIVVGEETGFQYHPEQTTSAIICHHPKAKYFVAR